MSTETNRAPMAALSRRSLLAWALSVAGIGQVFAQQTPSGGDGRFPDVMSAKVRAAPGGRFDFDITVSSPYDTPQRYADGFRVVAPTGAVLGERTLWHDHQGEQPFTRDLYAVPIPPGVTHGDDPGARPEIWLRRAIHCRAIAAAPALSRRRARQDVRRCG